VVIKRRIALKNIRMYCPDAEDVQEWRYESDPGEESIVAEWTGSLPGGPAVTEIGPALDWRMAVQIDRIRREHGQIIAWLEWQTTDGSYEEKKMALKWVPNSFVDDFWKRHPDKKRVYVDDWASQRAGALRAGRSTTEFEDGTNPEETSLV
jgi:hypothetical protein